MVQNQKIVDPKKKNQDWNYFSTWLAAGCIGPVTGAGVWCGAALAWDMANREGSVDIAHAVRSIRISRPGLVTSLGEYAMTRELVTRLVHT